MEFNSGDSKPSDHSEGNLEWFRANPKIFQSSPNEVTDQTVKTRPDSKPECYASNVTGIEKSSDGLDAMISAYIGL